MHSLTAQNVLTSFAKTTARLSSTQFARQMKLRPNRQMTAVANWTIIICYVLRRIASHLLNLILSVYR